MQMDGFTAFSLKAFVEIANKWNGMFRYGLTISLFTNNYIELIIQLTFFQILFKQLIS